MPNPISFRPGAPLPALPSAQTPAGLGQQQPRLTADPSGSGPSTPPHSAGGGSTVRAALHRRITELQQRQPRNVRRSPFERTPRMMVPLISTTPESNIKADEQGAITGTETPSADPAAASEQTAPRPSQVSGSPGSGERTVRQSSGKRESPASEVGSEAAGAPPAAKRQKQGTGVSEQDASVSYPENSLFSPTRDVKGQPPTLEELGIQTCIRRCVPLANLDTKLTVHKNWNMSKHGRQVLIDNLMRTMASLPRPYFVVHLSGGPDVPYDRSFVFVRAPRRPYEFVMHTAAGQPVHVRNGRQQSLKYLLNKHLQNKTEVPLLVMTPITPFRGASPELRTLSSLMHLGYYLDGEAKVHADPFMALKALGCRIDDKVINPKDSQEVAEYLAGEHVGALALAVTYENGQTSHFFWREDAPALGRQHESGMMFKGSPYEFFERYRDRIHGLTRSVIETTPAACEANLLTGMDKETVQSELAAHFRQRGNHIAEVTEVSLDAIHSVLRAEFTGHVRLQSFTLGTEDKPENESLDTLLNHSAERFLIEHVSPVDGLRVRHIFDRPGKQGSNVHAITLDDQGLAQIEQYSPAALLEELRSDGVDKVDILFAKDTEDDE